MKIIIIEDEVKTAKALAQLISIIRPECTIKASIQSIQSAVRYFSENEMPDLVFMDIQLADGLCFEIFRKIKITSPVVFCTAFDEHAIEAFKANGIDYILKPFSREAIQSAFDKMDSMQVFFQNRSHIISQLENLLKTADAAQGKKSFLVFDGKQYITIPTENICFFYIKNGLPALMTADQQSYFISQSLDEVAGLVDPRQFYRLNRQYLISFSAIKSVEHYFARKLLVHLIIPVPDKLLVGKDKATSFLSWLDNR